MKISIIGSGFVGTAIGKGLKALGNEVIFYDIIDKDLPNFTFTKDIDDLKEPHPSIPYNPLLFRQFYRVAYVEDVGGGTIDIIKTCKKAGLPEPEFEQKMGSFVTIIRRSALTEEYLEGMGLNERQITAVKHIGRYGKITRAEYENLCLVSDRTANRELGKLSKKKLIEKKGKGPETFYVLARFGEIWRDKRKNK
ncbi:MAG: ATP-binding protein [Halobacteriota archaeon]